MTKEDAASHARNECPLLGFFVVYFHSCLSAHVVVRLRACFNTDFVQRLVKSSDE